MDTNDTIQVFDYEFLSGDTGNGGVERTNSGSVSVLGNTVVISAQLINGRNLDATNKLVLLLEGTYDNKSWLNLHAANNIEFIANTPTPVVSTQITGVSFAAVRLRATLSGSSSSALFSAWLNFSSL